MQYHSLEEAIENITFYKALATLDLDKCYEMLDTDRRYELTKYLIEEGIDPLDYVTNLVKGVVGKDIQSLKLPNNIKNIDTNACRNCYDLTTVTIGNGVTSIGEEAFKYCTSLASVTIGNRVTSIGAYAFDDCDSLTRVNYLGTIDDWVQIEFSGYYANPLQYAKKLHINGKLVTEAIITTATRINDCVFRNCKSLTSVVIGKNVKNISDAAFSGCNLLSSIIYEGTIKEFEAVEKSREGDYGASVIKVICTDGEIDL